MLACIIVVGHARLHLCCLQGWFRTICFPNKQFRQTCISPHFGKGLPQLVKIFLQCLHGHSLYPVTPVVTVTTRASLFGWGAHLDIHIPFSAFDRGRCIEIMTGNVTCMFYINWQEGARLPFLCAEAERLCNWCIHCRNWDMTVYLPGVQNTTVDTFSRCFSPDYEWELDPWTLL